MFKKIYLLVLILAISTCNAVSASFENESWLQGTWVSTINDLPKGLKQCFYFNGEGRVKRLQITNQYKEGKYYIDGDYIIIQFETHQSALKIDTDNYRRLQYYTVKTTVVPWIYEKTSVNEQCLDIEKHNYKIIENKE